MEAMPDGFTSDGLFNHVCKANVGCSHKACADVHGLTCILRLSCLLAVVALRVLRLPHILSSLRLRMPGRARFLLAERS
jgi:hypothetical protein